MNRFTRLATTFAAVPVAFVALGAGPALAHNCVNASKPQDAGWRVLIDVSTEDETVTFASAGLEKQFASDPEAALERFAGILGIDFDGDGDADVSTYIVGPDGEVPIEAQERGAECRGIVTFDAYLACAAG